MERELLKKVAAYFAKEPVRDDEKYTITIQSVIYEPDFGRIVKRLLRLVAQSNIEALSWKKYGWK
ncbi:MAG: hypothetical protein HQK92_10275 [Nitrospirae bacterium]|nr:hypothetical protein [Nitrospirota bacterium]